MTEQEAYMWLGSSPCEGCSNCMVDENLKFDLYTSTKPRHYNNGFNMIKVCQENGGCLEYQKYEEKYNKLINE